MRDYVICGAGLFGLTFAEQAARKGKTSIIFDRRDHLGGNSYSCQENGIEVHKYGPHIFNTENEELWNYVNSFTPFNEYIHRVAAVTVDRKSYSFPLNRMSLDHLPKEEITERIESPKNFEEAAIKRVGATAYRLFYRDYTTKQWGRSPTELPAALAMRIPIRTTTYSANYHNTRFSGIPKKGYRDLAEAMSYAHGNKIQVQLATKCPGAWKWKKYGQRLVWSGSIDEYFGFQLGDLEYRKMQFATTLYQNVEDYQGIAQVNYTGLAPGITRSVEWRHFNPSRYRLNYTLVTQETPTEFMRIAYDTIFDEGRYYPIPTEKNKKLYKQYKVLAAAFSQDVIFGGRLGSYRYLNMDQTIASAIKEFEDSIL